MMYLKLMSAEDMPDNAVEKNFTVVQILDHEQLDFIRDGSQVVAHVTGDNSMRQFTLTGNAYVLNAQGKTIANRAPY
ncbi:hypothetical protein FUT88_13475 [Ralstonia sp. TCR112]|uniref:hypothetical protein n=1 Tax=Ralstonia sp. TCR112 TaxID=2601730 RepID=UPI0011BD7AD3|nr:hypothetical protein [Ralstonia sp. TCR112]TXD58880.1 hypothetical protein FUT88_13475 [Ralstonia sp. TCR112]